MLISLDSDANFVLAVQIGAGVLQAGVCDLEANLLASELRQFSLDSSPDSVLASAVTMLERCMETAGMSLDHVLGVGIGAAGLVDQAQRINLSSPNLGWVDVAMASYFEGAFGRPAVVDHNVRAMAIGESSYGLGRELESLAFIYIRTGVGAGLVLGGREYRGGTHGAVEFGHIQVEPQGELCKCGNRGCLETVASDQVIRSQVAAAGLIPDSAASESSTAWIDALLHAVQSGDRRAMSIRDEFVEYVARAMLSVINLLNPELIVLGGLLSDLGAVMVGPLQKILPSRVLPIVKDGVHVEQTVFGAQAGLIGAAAVALNHFVFGRPLVIGSSRLS